jgi:hypothetical protein
MGWLLKWAFIGNVEVHISAGIIPQVLERNKGDQGKEGDQYFLTARFFWI